MSVSRKYLVMWSGGIDSTWSLFTLLKNTNDPVFAHHVCKRSRTDDGQHLSRGFEYERAAVRAMIDWFGTYTRGFTYSESYIDLTCFPHFARDTITAAFMGAQAAMSWDFGEHDKLVMGTNGTEDEGNSDDPRVVYRTRFRSLMNQQTIQAVMQRDAVPDFAWIMPAPTRAQQIEDLPPDLLKLTASCRAPIEAGDGTFVRCGVCATCEVLTPFLPSEMLAEGAR